MRNAEASAVKPRIVLLLQSALLAFSVFAVAAWAICFPYPSPIIKPFLSPKLRWPTEQIMNWVETQNVDPQFKKFFYRDPERRVPAGPSLVAAADGVVQVDEVRDNVTYLVTGLSFWDVHVVRAPIAGTVKSIESEGVFYQRYPTHERAYVAFFLRGKAAPVQQIMTLDTRIGEVKIRLITSYWASRIKVWAYPGEHLEKGQRIGRMLLGSTVIVELPGKFALSVKKKEHLTAGETVISTEGKPL